MSGVRLEIMSTHEALSFIERAAWTSAKSTDDVAPHQYVVKGWDRDDITEEEFSAFAELVKAQGHEEIWTPPAEWVRRWGGRPMTNRYLYIGEYAYWFTCPRNSVPMLNREHVSVQTATPTRKAVAASAPPGFDPLAFVDNHAWTFAKTMPEIPHEYVVRGKNGCAEDDWDAFAAYINEHGFKARWTAPNGRQMENVYLELGEWNFWVIFPVINRERLEISTIKPL